MLDIKFIRENKEIVAAAIQNKKVKGEVDLDKLIQLSDQRKELRQKIDEINKKRNNAAKEQNIELGRQLKEEGSKYEEEFNEVDKEYLKLSLLVPNIPSADTPIGKDEEDNKVIRTFGEKTEFNFTPKEHFELGKDLGLIDSEKAAEISGSRFTYLKGDLALLQLAIINFAVSIVTDEDKLESIINQFDLKTSAKPFTFVLPPTVVKPAVLNRMARLEPKEDRYYIESDDLFLTGSAEHTLGPIHMDEILDEKDLPIRYLGYSTAFRREAGSYGKDTKGILRMHQFDKLEMESFCRPENSKSEQDLFVSIQEFLLQKLRIPYQVVMICTGDMGLPDYRQIDIECWMPGQNKYRETHTADLMTSFQSRRLNTRYKNEDGNVEHVHMNDATLAAIGRLIIAVIENYQQEDGTIKVPGVLVPYIGKEVIGK